MASQAAEFRRQESFSHYVRVLRRRGWIVAFAVVVTTAAAVVVSIAQHKTYTATASLLFRESSPGSTLSIAGAAPNNTDPFRQAATNLQLVTLPVVADLTARRLGNHMTGRQVASKVSVSPQGESDVIAVAARGQSPLAAQTLANTFAQAFIDYRRSVDLSAIRETQDLVQRKLSTLSQRERNGPRGRALASQADQLAVLASLQTGNAEIAQKASLPAGPSSPKPIRNAVLGFIVGAVVGLMLAFGVDRLDRRFRDPEEVEETFGHPVLGTVPASRSLVRTHPSSSDIEAFRVLQANLRYFDVGRDLRSVLVTSAAPGDGKTTVAWNLAVAAAQDGVDVLLIEADLRHGTFGTWCETRQGGGLALALAGRATLAEVVQTVPVRNEGQRQQTMAVVTAGANPPNPSALLASERMSELIKQAEHEYTLVLIDSPPVGIVSDAVALVPRTGGVIVVARLGNTERPALARLRVQLEHLSPSMLAVVVNGTEPSAQYRPYD